MKAMAAEINNPEVHQFLGKHSRFLASQRPRRLQSSWEVFLGRDSSDWPWQIYIYIHIHTYIYIYIDAQREIVHPWFDGVFLIHNSLPVQFAFHFGDDLVLQGYLTSGEKCRVCQLLIFRNNSTS